MISARKKYVLSAFLGILLMFGSELAWANETAWTGFLIDEHCFLKKADDPGSDTRDCKLMDDCVKGGYGIAVLQADGRYKFYCFDGKFFMDTKELDGTGGQKIAYEFIKASTKENYQPVTVRGMLEKAKKRSTGDSSIFYEVIAVHSLADATPHEARGLPTEGTVKPGIHKPQNGYKPAQHEEQTKQHDLEKQQHKND